MRASPASVWLIRSVSSRLNGSVPAMLLTMYGASMLMKELLSGSASDSAFSAAAYCDHG